MCRTRWFLGYRTGYDNLQPACGVNTTVSYLSCELCNVIMHNRLGAARVTSSVDFSVETLTCLIPALEILVTVLKDSPVLQTDALINNILGCMGKHSHTEFLCVLLSSLKKVALALCINL